MFRVVIAGLAVLAVICAPSLTTAAEFDRSSKVILVAGATGTQGGAVARELAARGYQVRSLTRNPQSAAARAVAAEGVQMVQGDFNDPASLDAALEGAYGAFSVQQYRGIGVDNEIRHGREFADAALRAGVEHFIYTSVEKAPLDTGVPQFESKLVIEAHIREIGIPYTIIRPATFMTWIEELREEAMAGEISGPLPPDKVRNYISPADIGRFAAEAFDNPSVWLGREFNIASDALSYAEIAETLSRVMQQPVVYRQIPWQEHIRGLSQTAIERDTWYLENDVVADIPALRRQFPWLESFETYLIENGWGP